jgi:RNA polymerase sigma factor (sigma-70 family)
MSLHLTQIQRDRAVTFSRGAAAIARRIAVGSGMLHMLDDLRGVAFEALSRAALDYDPKKAAFSTYAWRRVTGAVLSAVRTAKKRMPLEVPLDVIETIGEGGAADEDAILGRIDATLAELMEAFVLGCAGVEWATNGEAHLLRRERHAELAAAMAALAPEDRLLFELRHREGWTWQPIAERLGISVRTAKYHDARIRADLRATLCGRGG